MVYDCAVIGTGPAGFSAALNLQIRNKKFVWFGSKDFSEKVEKAEEILNYPGFYAADGKTLQAAFTDHAEKMGLEITESMINEVVKFSDHYALMAGADFFEAKTVILATGVSVKATLENEAAFLGRGVSYCATCDGMLYRGRDVVVAGYAADAPEGAASVLLAALDSAMRQFTAMRETEGEHLKADFLKRIETLSGYVEEIAAMGPEIVPRYRERITATVRELLAEEEIDEARIIQETAIYADKVNYTEEMVRLRSHFEQFRRIVNETGGPVGRKLDFLIQEMNREINTTASKANSTRATQLAVEVKSEIEKLREQVQNIE